MFSHFSIQVASTPGDRTMKCLVSKLQNVKTYQQLIVPLTSTAHACARPSAMSRVFTTGQGLSVPVQKRPPLASRVQSSLSELLISTCTRLGGAAGGVPVIPKHRSSPVVSTPLPRHKHNRW